MIVGFIRSLADDAAGEVWWWLTSRGWELPDPYETSPRATVKAILGQLRELIGHCALSAVVWILRKLDPK